ncbi:MULTISPECIES: hypothetical protein [unclassified Haloferax]|uniref:hypothetical protein n=1 Tax=unclassified Haloferax TaxID=2625095 RepID=UPI0028751A09|nr:MULTISPECIES: hypothetical protein [unclassified Haloferax]MDS0243943.1 hypothetical protein [Haloferax sp. S2CR25]MDS0447064.1 hypothetical protein [Haloferax sp. S2CR25-2]
MAGGSVEPENRRDQRCHHCKRYFSDRGIKAHESNCFVAEIPFELVPEDEVEADDDAGVETGGTPPVESVGGESPEPADGVGGSGMPPSNDSTAVTDGGEAMEVPDFDRPDEVEEVADALADEGMEVVDRHGTIAEPETEDCPACGSDTEMTRDELVDGKKYRCTDCRETFVWRDE